MLVIRADRVQEFCQYSSQRTILHICHTIKCRGWYYQWIIGCINSLLAGCFDIGENCCRKLLHSIAQQRGQGLCLFSCDQAALQMVFSVCLSVYPCLSHLFTRGQFWPSGIVVACVCVCVCVCVSVCLCVNHLLVRAITRDPFKLGSPNLDRRCKRPWLRSLLFWGAIDLDLQGQI